MDIDEALNLIKTGKVAIWNQYREEHPDWIPDFSGLDLSEMQFVIYKDSSANILQFHSSEVDIEVFDLSNAIFYGTTMPSDRLAYEPFRLFSERGIRGVSLPPEAKANLHGAVYDAKTIVPYSINLEDYGAKYVTQDEVVLNRDPQRTRVFISYAWANDELVLAIEKWLRQKNIDTRIDKRDFFAGSRIRDEIIRVMNECEVILIFHSKESVDKPWIDFERELAADLEMEAKKEKKTPPRIIYVVTDDVPLPSITEKNRLAIMAKGRKFGDVCQEIYQSILKIPRYQDDIDLDEWIDKPI